MHITTHWKMKFLHHVTAFEWILLFHSPQMELCNGHKSDKCESIRPFSPSYPGQSPFMATLNRVTQIHTDQKSYSHLAHTLKVSIVTMISPLIMTKSKIKTNWPLLYFYHDHNLTSSVLWYKGSFETLQWFLVAFAKFILFHRRQYICREIW